MGPRHDLSFCAWTTACLASGLLVSMGLGPYLWFCACKAATLGPAIQVCMGPIPHFFF